jgi:hypothetical protein
MIAIWGGAACFLAAASPASAHTNYDQVAVLKWYANQVTTHPVGKTPSALAIDGKTCGSPNRAITGL